MSLSVNGYVTQWKNGPADRPYSYHDDVNDETYRININGMDALHMGLEAEFTHKPLKNLEYGLLFSLGDWRWMSEDTARIYVNEQLAKEFYFNARGVHVGDAAQFQTSADIRWEIIRRLYVTGVVTYFTKNYAEFDPLSLSPEINPNYLDEDGNPRDSWKMPDYALVDLHGGYTFRFGKNTFLDIRGSVLNLLNTKYISDAQNNDSYSTSTMDFDAKSAGVYFGLGRRFNISARISF
jgi:outer membrane receptor protein involved in Fe transport